MAIPIMLPICQQFPSLPPVDLEASLTAQFQMIRIQPGAKIALAVGSRGIDRIHEVVRVVISLCRQRGAHPFIVPAMGSHGGAESAGQKSILATYGITEEALHVPIDASMEVDQVGTTSDGAPIFFSAAALKADGILLINRIKPHTDFFGNIGSGLLKILVVGLGKQRGAAHYHFSSSRHGYEQVLRSTARALLACVPVAAGIALLESATHALAEIKIVLPSSLEREEEALFAKARHMMPRLPATEIDLLIVDAIGKNISGAGLDPNITGRAVHGYSSLLNEPGRKPNVKRLFVRDLTPETQGNAIGIGLADFTTKRLASRINSEITNINALTSLTPQAAKVPIVFQNDRIAIDRALASLGRPECPRIVRIPSTLSLDRIEVSTALEQEAKENGSAILGDPFEMKFDGEDNLLPI